MSCWKLMGLHTVTLSNTHTTWKKQFSLTKHSKEARVEWERKRTFYFLYFFSFTRPYKLTFTWDIYTPHTTISFFVFIIWLSKKKTKKNYSLHKILSLISYTFRSSTYSFQKLNWTLNTPPPLILILHSLIINF